MKPDISSSSGNLAVRACAGAGKTRALVESYISRYRLGGSRLLAITFTDMAAGEMRSRIANSIKDEIAISLARKDEEGIKHLKPLLLQLPDLEISTFHSFCRGLLVENSALLGLEPNIEILETNLCSRLRKSAAFTAIERVLSDISDADSSIAVLLDSVDGKALVDLIVSAFSDPLWLHSFEDALQNTLPPFVSPQTPPGIAAHLESLHIAGIDVNTDTLDILSGLFLTNAGKPYAAKTLNGKLKNTPYFHLLHDIDHAGEIAQAIASVADWVRATVHEEHERMLFSGLAHIAKMAGEEYEYLKAGRLDYEDLQFHAYRLLCSGRTECSNAVAEARARYSYVFVDEFQDTDLLQWRILTSLLGIKGDVVPQDRLFIVGDEQQSIYGFRGAEIANFSAALEMMSHCTRSLSTNYRSAKGIVNFCNSVFSNLFAQYDLNPQGVSYMPMTASSEEEGSINLCVVSDRQQQAPVVCDILLSLLQGSDGEPPMKPGNIAVLSRRHSELAELAPYLAKEGLPFTMKVTDSLIEALPIRDTAVALSVVLDATNDLQLAHFLRSPLCGLSDAALFEISCNGGANLCEQLTVGLPTGWTIAGDAKALAHALEYLDVMPGIFASKPLDSALDELYDYCGVPLAYAALPYGSTAVDELEFLRHLARCHAANGEGIAELLDGLNEGLTVDSGASSRSSDRISLLTVHASKGLEFKALIFTGAGGSTGRSHGRYREYVDCGLDNPAPVAFFRFAEQSSSDEGRGDAQSDSLSIGPWMYLARETEVKRSRSEELRLLYVAFTRARDNLFVVGAPAARSAKFSSHSNMGMVLSSLSATGDIFSDKHLEGEGWKAEYKYCTPSRLLAYQASEVIEGAFSRIAVPPLRGIAIPDVPSLTELTGVTSLAGRLAGLEQKSEPADTDDSFAGEDIVPRGIVFGRALHTVLEYLPRNPHDTVKSLVAAGRLPRDLANSILNAYDNISASLAVAGLLTSPDRKAEWPFILRIGRFLVRGKIDLLAFQNGSWRVVDFKSGVMPEDKARLDSYRFQLAIYCRAVGELLAGGGEVKGCAVFSASDDILHAASPEELNLALAMLSENLKKHPSAI